MCVCVRECGGYVCVGVCECVGVYMCVCVWCVRVCVDVDAECGRMFVCMCVLVGGV